MKKTHYRDAISHAWHFTWHHKGLWVFGFFAAFLGHMGVLPLLSTVGVIGSGAQHESTLAYLINLGYSFMSADWSALSVTLVGGATWVLVALAAMAALLIGAAIISQGALIHAASRSTRVIKALPTPEKSWHIGASHFWRLLGINAIRKVLLGLCGAAVYWSTYRAVVEGGMFFASLSFVAFILACIVGLAASFLTIYAAGYVVVEEYSFGRALSSAWSLFTSHWMTSLEVGVIVLACNLLVGLFGMFSFFLFMTPALVLMVVSIVLSLPLLAVAAVITSLSLFLLFVILLGSSFSVFSTTVWTYLFMKMHGHGISSRLLEWAGHEE